MKVFSHFFIAVFFLIHSAGAQKYFTKTAIVTFESNTPMEKINATNKSGTVSYTHLTLPTSDLV